MRFYNGKIIVARYHAKRVIVESYKGLKLFWKLAKDIVTSGSCFGSGYWIDENPWLNGEGWNDNQ